MKNGSPSPPRAPPLLSPNFYSVHPTGTCPAGRSSAAFLDGMKTNSSAGNSCPPCLFVQSLAGLEPGEALHATTACAWTSKVFGGMGGRGPLLTKGPIPPREKMFIRRTRQRRVPKGVCVCCVPRLLKTNRVWLAWSRARPCMPRRLASGQVKFLGGWGVWGEGPLGSQRGPSPHENKKQKNKHHSA